MEMKSHLNRDAVPFSPRAIPAQNISLPPISPPISPAPTPSLMSNASDVSDSECRTPTDAVFDMHMCTDSLPQGKAYLPNRAHIFSATYPDPLLTGCVPKKTKKVKTRVVFTPDSHATPYVPSIVRQRAEASKVDIEEQKDEEVNFRQLPLDAAFIFPFRCASSKGVIRTIELRKDKLIPLVQKGNWDFASLSQLAGMFIDRVVESCSDYIVDNTTNALAHFAILVYDEFCMQVGPSCGSYFMGSLRSCLLSEFRAWWLARNPCSVVNLYSKTPCPPHKPVLYNLSIALTVAKFVGDLFSWGGCSASLVKLCLDIVAHNLSCVEELECILNILERCDKVLYQQIRMNDFLKQVKTRVAKMTSGSAACYDPPVKDVIESYVQRITNFVEGWASTEAEPPVNSPLDMSFKAFMPDAEERNPWTKEEYFMQDDEPYLPHEPELPPPPEPMPALPPVPQPTQASTFRAPAAQTLSYWPAPPPPEFRYINPFLVAQAAYLRRVANGMLALPTQPQVPSPQYIPLPPQFQNGFVQPSQLQVVAQFGHAKYQERENVLYEASSEGTFDAQTEQAVTQAWNEHVRDWSNL